MNEFINRRNGTLIIYNATAPLIPAEDADFIQFENNHEDDRWDDPDKEYNERKVN